MNYANFEAKRSALDKNELNKLHQYLNTPQQILISTHRSPDGDAIGSSLALANALIKKGHSVQVVVPDRYPNFLRWMKGNDLISVFEDDSSAANEMAAEADLLFALDYNALNRIGDFAPAVKASKAFKVMIDHHQQPEAFADITISKPEASSTAELIYDFLDELDWLSLIDQSIAECIYTGIVTDTGSFRFNSTAPRTHRIAAALMEKGLKTDVVFDHVFDTNRVDRLRLMGYTLSEKLVVLPSVQCAYISLSVEELERFNFQRGDTEGLVNYGLSIEGIQLAAFFRESKDSDYIRISFRSKGDVDVNYLARTYFNGGGHTNAAGGRSDLSLEATIERFERIVAEENPFHA